jgi:hypothetical protein
MWTGHCYERAETGQKHDMSIASSICSPERMTGLGWPGWMDIAAEVCISPGPGRADLRASSRPFRQEVRVGGKQECGSPRWMFVLGKPARRIFQWTGAGTTGTRQEMRGRLFPPGAVCVHFDAFRCGTASGSCQWRNFSSVTLERFNAASQREEGKR